MELELADIVARHGPGYLARHGEKVPAGHRRALRAIAGCRTGKLGGHLYACGGCGKSHFAGHSCHHRSCPRCGGARAVAWREKVHADLLPVPYFLITFTVPSELRALFRREPRACLGALFAASAATLQEAAAQKLKAELGMIGVLHTWTRMLAYHPHVHYLVPGGGLRRDGKRQWRKCPRVKDGQPYLLPVKQLAKVVRGKLKAALEKALPEEMGGVPAAAWEKEWVVNCQPAGEGHAAAGYLARYVQQTALGNKRIVGDDERGITFTYTPSGQTQSRTLTLAPDEFLRRVLQHVLPKGLQRVRYYGWLHPNAKRRLILAQTLCAARLDLRPAPPAPPPRHLRCPHCGEYALERIARLPPIRGP